MPNLSEEESRCPKPHALKPTMPFQLDLGKEFAGFTIDLPVLSNEQLATYNEIAAKDCLKPDKQPCHRVAGEDIGHLDNKAPEPPKTEVTVELQTVSTGAGCCCPGACACHAKVTGKKAKEAKGKAKEKAPQNLNFRVGATDRCLCVANQVAVYREPHMLRMLRTQMTLALCQLFPRHTSVVLCQFL